jgi:hypothetical protein
MNERDSGHRDPGTPQCFHRPPPTAHRPPAATSTGHPISNCAAVDSATAAAPTPSCNPDPQAPVNITGFNDYTAVRPCDYPGPTHFGWSSTRFKTTGWVHCDLDDPASFQNPEQLYRDGKVHGFYLFERGSRVY